MKIYFDLDGTLWQPHAVAIAAFKQTLKRLGLPQKSDAELLDTLGYPIPEIWQRLWPGGTPRNHQRAAALMDEEETRLLRAGHGELYTGVLETLQQLKEWGCSLYILSNCGTNYLHEVPQALKIYGLFSGFYCAEMYPGSTKAEILKQLLQGDTCALMVGDRHHDIEAGRANGIPTVWCRYGLARPGEISGADYVIDRFDELLPIVRQLLYSERKKQIDA